MFNCTRSYLENDSNYSKPMPWIGLYIAAASLLCAILVLADLILPPRRSQIWTPSRCFRLNSFTLTVLAVAIKLSVDLTTAMPRAIDQLAKLSTSVLICISIVHFIPSLGEMADIDIITNSIALVILVITSVVNLCIQINTGVIYAFTGVHIFLIGSMIYLSMVCYCTVIALLSIKRILRYDSAVTHRVALDEFDKASSTTNRLEVYLTRFSVMSISGSPHIVLGRIGLSFMPPYICLADILLFYAFIIPYYLRKLHLSFIIQFEHSTFCEDESDYEWSASLVFAAQILVTLVGFIIMFQKILFLNRIQPVLAAIRTLRKVQICWYFLLIYIRRRPLFAYIRDKGCKKYVHNAKKYCCNFLIAMQILMVFTIKALALGIRCPFWALLSCIRSFIPNSLPSDVTSPSHGGGLGIYVLVHIDDIFATGLMLDVILDAVDKYIEEAKKEEPAADLLKFLKTDHSPGFPGVLPFNSNEDPRFAFEIPRRFSISWSLSVVTLTSVALLLPNIEPHKAQKLLTDVRGGLVFVKKIEENLNDVDNIFIEMGAAADIVWEEIEVHGRRSDIQFKRLAELGNNPHDILQFLADSPIGSLVRMPSASIKRKERMALLALCAECKSILKYCRDENFPISTTDDLFRMLSSRIRNILVACLSNLEHSILHKCSLSNIENMSETARDVLNLFARTRKIADWLKEVEIPDLGPGYPSFTDGRRHGRSSETVENRGSVRV